MRDVSGLCFPVENVILIFQLESAQSSQYFLHRLLS
jgi:hypothetical protein